jgi:hypothetical protein
MAVVSCGKDSCDRLGTRGPILLATCRTRTVALGPDRDIRATAREADERAVQGLREGVTSSCRVRVQGPKVTVVQQRKRCGSIKTIEPPEGPLATREGASVGSTEATSDHPASVSSDRSGQIRLVYRPLERNDWLHWESCGLVLRVSVRLSRGRIRIARSAGWGADAECLSRRGRTAALGRPGPASGAGSRPGGGVGRGLCRSA